jgi:hypothetical protein
LSCHALPFLGLCCIVLSCIIVLVLSYVNSSFFLSFVLILVLYCVVLFRFHLINGLRTTGNGFLACFQLIHKKRKKYEGTLSDFVLGCEIALTDCTRCHFIVVVVVPIAPILIWSVPLPHAFFLAPKKMIWLGLGLMIWLCRLV